MNIHDFGDYDREQLEKAKQILLKVYEYHEPDGAIRTKTNRLATIISKIDELLKM